jgi:hypothetical protein
MDYLPPAGRPGKNSALTRTTKPPLPTLAMLGETIVHAQDIRLPLGIRPWQWPGTGHTATHSKATVPRPCGSAARPRDPRSHLDCRPAQLHGSGPCPGLQRLR